MQFEIWWVFVFVGGLAAIKGVTRIVTSLIERNKTTGPRELAEIAEKVERTNQAVEAIAIEVERINESQRFLTRVLSETKAAQLGK